MPLSILLQKFSGIAIAILGALLAYQLALLTWSFFPDHQSKYQWVAPKKLASNNQINTQKLQQQHLFGEITRTKRVVLPIKPVSVAPKTTLNVVLVGVVAASDPEYSSAIISAKGKQGSYFIGSDIDGTSASVSEIYQDRVILNVNGALQTLMLDGIDHVDSKAPPRERQPRVRRTEEVVDVDLDREELLADPSKLTDYIRISPYREDGQVLGYRLRPGKDPALFEQAGFEKNDLAVELNGVDLTDTQEAFSLMKAFPSMTEINVTVERDGQLYELSLNIQ